MLSIFSSAVAEAADFGVLASSAANTASVVATYNKGKDSESNGLELIILIIIAFGGPHGRYPVLISPTVVKAPQTAADFRKTQLLTE